MVKKFFQLLFLCGFFFQANAGIPQKIDLGGQWEFRKAGTAKWYPATVPGCVQLDLLKNHLIKDPFIGTNEDSVQWISENSWEYRRIFYTDPTLFSIRQIDLVFEGLDTYATVYLNDSLIIVANNMFREWTYVNAKYKLMMGKNELRIVFPSVTNRNKELYAKLKFKLPGDEKVVCRKAAYDFGWDWGPKMITMGIWKPVYLKLYQRVNVSSVRFVQKKLTDSTATISGIFTLSSNLQDTANIRIMNGSEVLLNHTANFKKGENVIRADFVIKNPKLWWPNGMGEPFLYTLRYSVTFINEIVDTGSQRIGLRSIELIQQADKAGASFKFLVNKKPVFIKGANYIPQDNFPSRVRDSAYRALLTDVKSLHMNMLRVWGGGIYEKDIFYDLCDELGIMVWQDFMFACAMYPDDKDFLQNADAESIQNIIRLRKHACLALWCGNNEIDEGWKNWGWVKQYNYSPKDSARIYGAYQALFKGILPYNIQRFDTLRPYISTSPMFGWGDPKSSHTGDMHYWGVWWGRQPFSKYREVVGRFMSEYGFQSFPDISTLRRISRPADLKLGSPFMMAHQKHPTGYELIDEYMIRDYNRPQDFESYVYVSQILQAEGIETAIEAHRRAMPYCMGTLFWQFNDCWPAVSWSARDYYGTPKALHYYIRHAYDDILVSSILEKGRYRVYLVSDRLSATEGNLCMRITGFDGKVISETIKKVQVPPMSSGIYFDSDSASFTAGLDLKKVVLTAVLTTAGTDSPVYSGSFYFKPVKELGLEKAVITKEIKETSGGFRIILKSDKLAKNVFLSTSVKGTFSDNFRDIIPGIPLEIIFYTSYKNKDLEGKINIRTLRDTY